MQATLERLVEANIMNIKIVEQNGQFHILPEWSHGFVESFDEYEDAQSFVKGYIGEETENTLPYQHGNLYRSFVETDIAQGTKYYKVIDISKY